MKLLREEIAWRQLRRGAWVLAPLLALSLATGNANWLKASVVTISLFVVCERLELAPLGVALHAAALLLLFMALLCAMHTSVIFILACVLAAAAAVGISAFGGKLRSLGNFIFIPALYLACETAEGGAGALLAQCGWAQLPFLGAAVLPVLMLALAEHRRLAQLSTSDSLHHYLQLRRSDELGARVACGEALLAVSCAVALSAAIVEWQHLDYGQWVIWSAVSVISGDMAATRNKLRQRASGALLGVPVGILLGSLMPHGNVGYELLSVVTMLTLVSFHRYTLGFGARCACIACALVIAGKAPSIAAERVVNVLLGGGIGLLFALAVHAVLPPNAGTRQ
ncbi:FUSC family protein [Serratia marcescens]|uniref:FUSC family protein n=1 Tax=Serratia marcescens TaxID=615 RepID=UPI001EEFE050|nr:FUSC family protein [Serratia marcescens]ULH13487.1 FUSC family protein [Serratia marcescens]